MLNTNVTNFLRNIFSLLEQTVKYNEPVNISTKDGNAIVLSEEEYRGILATLELLSSPEMRQKLAEGRAAPLEDCIPDSEVGW